MNITGTHFNYYHICHRKLWLFSNNIQMEQTSDLVYEGSLIHENSYTQRSNRYEEVQIEGVKVDFYDPIKRVIHEIKKSNSLKEAHRWQLKYYIYVFEQNGINKISGVLEYPKLRKREEIFLSDIDREEICSKLLKIEQVINQNQCPILIKKRTCSKCAYYDFCYSSEIE